MALMSKNIALLTFLYFIQGLPYGFQASFLPMYLRMQGVSLTNLGLFKLLLLPWMCKALWAPLVDKKATKQKWLLWSVSGLVFICAFASLSSPTNLFVLCFIVFCLNLFAATQDIAVDGIAVALLTAEELGKGNTAQVVGYKIGSIFGGGVLVWFMDSLGWSGLFLVLTLLYIEALLFIYLSPTLRNLQFVYKTSSREAVKDIECSTECSEQSRSDDVIESENHSHHQEDGDRHVDEKGGSLSKERSVDKNDSFDGSDSNRSDSFEIVDNDQVPTLDDNVQSDLVTDTVRDDDNICTKEDAQEEQEEANKEAIGKARQRKTKIEVDPETVTIAKSEVEIIDVNGSDEIEEEKEEEFEEFNPIESVTQWTSKLVGTSLESVHEVVCVPGTLWMMIYVLIYKLGEQGAIGMLPLFLVDKKIKASDTTFWMGVVGQAVSIIGSFLGGFFLSKHSFPTSMFLQQLALCRLVPMGVTLWVVALWQWKMLPLIFLYYAAILAAMFMLLISGMVTTVTFTFMMQCSQGAHMTIQATHYTFLATLEVFGKLVFMSIAGWLVDIFDYAPMYLVFTGLAAVIMYWFQRMPKCLGVTAKLKQS